MIPRSNVPTAEQFSCAPDAAALLASGLLDDRHRTVFQRVADADAAGSGAGQHDSNVVSASARSVEQVKPIPIGQVAVAAATQQPLQATPRSLGLRGGGNPVMSSLGRVSLSAAQMEAAQHSSAAARFSPSRQEQQVLDETVCTVVDSLQFIVSSPPCRYLCSCSSGARSAHVRRVRAVLLESFFPSDPSVTP